MKQIDNMDDKKKTNSPVIFSPDNEPYLGRELLFHFDQLITCCLEQNALVAPKTYDLKLTDLQKMACQVIPQSISIGLSIRELIRQGYLFGGHVLVRSLAERAMILMYLDLFPNKINLWNNGWKYNEAPSLAKMFDVIKNNIETTCELKAYELTAHMNSLVHGKPDSALWNIVEIDNERLGHASSKILNNSKLCDELCVQTTPYLVIVLSMICKYFPKIEPNKNTNS